MTYYVTNPWGDSYDEPSVRTMRKFLVAIDPDDAEHGAAWLSDDAERSREMNGDGTLLYSLGEEPPRHLANVPLEQALELWCLLAEGRIAELEAQPWQPGLRASLTPEEAARREAERARAELARAREFYEVLGPERPDVPCRRDGCKRGCAAPLASGLGPGRRRGRSIARSLASADPTNKITCHCHLSR